MPWQNGCAVVLIAYLDASKRDGGIFSVGAVGFGASRAKKATKKWCALWGATTCHMTDLHTRKVGSAFENWTPERAGEQLEKSVAIINATASFVVSVSCDIAELNRLAPKSADPKSRVLLGGLNSAYAVCSHLAMCSIAELADDRTEIAYFFESGDDGQPSSQKFISAIAEHPQSRKRLYKYRSHTVAVKSDSRLFEIADIIAWEWAKQVTRSRENKGMRPSLRALLGDEKSLAAKGPTNLKSRTRRGWHTTGEPLEQYYRRVRELGLLED